MNLGLQRQKGVQKGVGRNAKLILNARLNPTVLKYAAHLLCQPSLPELFNWKAQTSSFCLQRLVID